MVFCLPPLLWNAKQRGGRRVVPSVRSHRIGACDRLRWTCGRSGDPISRHPGSREHIRPAAASSSGRRSSRKAPTRERSLPGSSTMVGHPRRPWRRHTVAGCTERSSTPAAGLSHGPPRATSCPPALSTDAAPHAAVHQEDAGAVQFGFPPAGEQPRVFLLLPGSGPSGGLFVAARDRGAVFPPRGLAALGRFEWPLLVAFVGHRVTSVPFAAA
jgi:hypothetical protein